jgi:hypothetical protein
VAAYLSFEEYQERGGALGETEFARAEYKARKRIDYLTDCRVQRMAEVPEAVKFCIMELIAVDQKIGSSALAESPLASSFNTDGYSESYGSGSDQAALLQKSVDSTIKELLYGEEDDNGVPLLYRGVAGSYPTRGWSP